MDNQQTFYWNIFMLPLSLGNLTAEVKAESHRVIAQLLEAATYHNVCWIPGSAWLATNCDSLPENVKNTEVYSLKLESWVYYLYIPSLRSLC